MSYTYLESSPFWKYCSPLVLASSSGIRAEILNNAAIPLEVIPASIDEREIEKNILKQNVSLSFVASSLAIEKAKKISLTHKDRYVLGCDQILIFDNEILTKSVSRETGLMKIKEMAGKQHELVSAAALFYNGEILAEVTDKVKLHMRSLSDEFYEWYFHHSGDALISSVGGYHFEKSGSHLFEKIEGDYFSILGLPLLPLLNEFRRLELVIP